MIAIEGFAASLLLSVTANPMQSVQVGLAAALVLGFADRLRQISWWSVKPAFVALYLTHLIWAISELHEAVDGNFTPHDFTGIAAMAAMLFVTRPNWSRGVPEAFKTGKSHQPQPDL